MATLHITEADLDDVIRRDWWHTLRHQAPYPGAAIVAAGLAYLINTHISALAMGAALAWLWSLHLTLREIRPTYVEHFANLRDPYSLVVEDGGLRFRGDPGESYLTWDAISTYNYPGAFVIYDEDQMFALLPKRHLSSDDILTLEAKSKFRAGW